jgi:hypothetical protein
VSFRGLDELCQDAAGRRRVQEGDTAAADPPARLLVDQSQAAVTAEGECARDVVAAVGGVVKAGAALAQELSDGGVLAQRREELDMRVANSEQHGLYALLLDRLPVLRRHLEQLAVELHGGVEILDGDADVIKCVEKPGYAAAV